MKAVLAYNDVAAIGRDAVMVEDPTAVTEGGESLSKVVEESTARNVLGNEVLTVPDAVSARWLTSSSKSRPATWSVTS